MFKMLLLMLSPLNDLLPIFYICCPYFTFAAHILHCCFICRRPDEGLFTNLSSFSNPYVTDSGNVSRSDTSLHAENQRLRDMLEKERYRRKVR